MTEPLQDTKEGGEPSPLPEDPETRLFERALEAFRRTEPTGSRRSGAFWLGFSALLFVLWKVLFAKPEGGRPVLGIVVVLGVLLLHELGHFAAMRLFGYRDLKIFFIPLFGAAATGRKHTAPSWQRALVVLAGPLPGIVLAAGLHVAFAPSSGQPLQTAILTLLAINAFNLLPLVPLDGGRFLEITVFSRSPLAEGGFLLLAGLGLAGLSLALDAWVLLLIAVLGLLDLPRRFSKARQRSLLQAGIGRMLPSEEDVSDRDAHVLFRVARLVSPEANKPESCARLMREVHEQAVVRPPSLSATLWLGGIYGAGIALAVLTAVLMIAGVAGPEVRAARALSARIAEVGKSSEDMNEALQAVEQAKREGDGDEGTLAEAARLRLEDLRRTAAEALREFEQSGPRVRSLACGGDENAARIEGALRTLSGSPQDAPAGQEGLPSAPEGSDTQEWQQQE